MTKRKNSTVEEKFLKAGVIVKKLTTVEDLKNNSWVMPTTDRRGMIKIQTKILNIDI